MAEAALQLPPAEGKKKQFILNAFVMQTPGHLNPGLFRRPGDQGGQYKDLAHWIEFAQKMEAAKFHAIFFADVLGAYDVYKGPRNIGPTLPAGAQFPFIDPLYTVPAMAAATKNIGFGVTASTTYEHPYALARRFSTVDHLTKGRVAWNIVTSYLDSAARNFGLDTQIEHDERYRRADEYLHIVYKLWEGSWREDAVLFQSNSTSPPKSNAISKDSESPLPENAYANPSLVREINHHTDLWDVPGPHTCEPSPQRTPFLFQAGTSSAGRAFAAKHAEAVFIGAQLPSLAKATVSSIRQQADEVGRDPASVKVMLGVLVIVAPTDAEAHAKYDELKRWGDLEGALALFGGWTGLDVGPYGWDDDLTIADNPGLRLTVNRWASTVPGSEGLTWTKRRLAEFLSVGGMAPKVIGSPQTVADELERWVDEADLDGFNLEFASIPDTFDDIAEYLLPELKRRGRFWNDYAVPGGTVRENYLGIKGQRRLLPGHPGAQYVWRAGEDVPAYALSEKAEKANGNKET